MTLPVRADVADLLAAGDHLAGVDADRGLVAVPDLGAVIEGLDGLVAVGAVVAGLGDRCRWRRPRSGCRSGPRSRGRCGCSTRGRWTCRSGRSGGSRWSAAPTGSWRSRWPASRPTSPARTARRCAAAACYSAAFGQLLVGRVLQGLALAVAAESRARAAVEADGVGAEGVELGERGGLGAVRGAAGRLVRRCLSGAGRGGNPRGHRERERSGDGGSHRKSGQRVAVGASAALRRPPWTRVPEVTGRVARLPARWFPMLRYPSVADR